MSEISPEEKKIRDGLRSPIIEAMEGEGITIKSLAKSLREELKAEEIKVFNDKGTIIYSKGVPALDIQQRARIDAHKLRGDYPAEEHRITGEMVNTRSPEEIEELRSIAQGLAKAIRKKGK